MLVTLLATIDWLEENDKEKLACAYNEYRDIMYNLAYSILDDQMLAEDAVHDSFISFAKNLQKVNNVPCHKTLNYLLIIVRNASFKIYNERKKCIATESISETLPDLEIGLTEKVEADDEMHRLFDLVKSLNKNYSDIILLKFYHELENDEIASLLNITEDNVRKRLQRARNKLKEMMEDDSYND